ncbi:hypothetical protein, partial [Croceicoccus naphthovorans]|uniref:hypothetical protein n=1 Tax=Croceicoccus naphthovorans TaxID=1348774 RepID=UPI001C871231
AVSPPNATPPQSASSRKRAPSHHAAVLTGWVQQSKASAGNSQPPPVHPDRDAGKQRKCKDEYQTFEGVEHHGLGTTAMIQYPSRNRRC